MNEPKNPKIITKIIAGAYRGKHLELPSLEVTRSSKAILKESYFNTLQFDIVDALFVELFAGSGSIGLEALSRGAKEVYFFEKDNNSFGVLKRNIAKLEPAKCHATHGDVFLEGPKFFATLPMGAYIYVDPPFAIRPEMDDIYTRTLALIARIPNAALITIEHMTGVELPQTIGAYKQTKRKKFGKTTLSYYAL